MTPVFFALFSAAALAAETPAPSASEVYAQRVSLAAADDSCALFSAAERALLNALAARSRDDAARAGDAPADLDRFEARFDATPDACDTPQLEGAARRHRDHAEALAGTHEIAFPGVHQDWISERRDRGAPLWRVRQTDRARAAMLGIHAGDDGDLMALALRSETPPAFAVMVLRDPSRQPEPVDFSASGLLSTPFDDPLSAWGGASGAQRRITASGRLDADAAMALAPAGGSSAYAFSFPETAILALRALAPRDGVRVELVGPRGEVLDRLWFEVGMFNAALAVQALPLPEPEPATALTAAR